MTPTRFLDTPSVRAHCGEKLVESFGCALSRTDARADEVVTTFRALAPGQGWRQLGQALEGTFDGVHPVIAGFVRDAAVTPAWVDRQTVDTAGATLLRAGPLGGLVLGLYSLPYGYASPGGNKPLAFSGRLKDQAPRRLMETARFVHAVALPGGMRVGGEGFCTTLKVRLMHAQVRRLLWDSGRWDEARWGVPINQHDLVATTLLFSVVVLDGLRKLGLRIGREEAEGYVHLWRYVGWLMGAEEGLLPASEADGLRVGELMQLTQAEPDEDSRALTEALMTWGLKAARTQWERRRVEAGLPFSRAVAHLLLGRRLALQLGIEASPVEAVLPAVRAATRAMERVRGLSPRAHEAAIRRGDRAWRAVIEDGLRGVPAEFRPPSGLRGAPR
ncbi:MAG: DUF2236 domain-containing protein [Myxococcaceae bacterium]|nr:DUF2236 domain-containing protein [Myxococcaceae bacterium]